MNNKKAKKPQPTYREIQLAILEELRLHTERLTAPCKQQAGPAAATGGLLSKSILEDEMKRRSLIEPTSLSANSAASDPFAPTFEVLPSATGYTATITLREGSVVYLVMPQGRALTPLKFQRLDCCLCWSSLWSRFHNDAQYRNLDRRPILKRNSPFSLYDFSDDRLVVYRPSNFIANDWSRSAVRPMSEAFIL